ncbi:hypothetical protein IF2G_00081 [Cordyceps javanica]|nr:hypothetical protein IF2G_00081 [Cordyceps javanica]
MQRNAVGVSGGEGEGCVKGQKERSGGVKTVAMVDVGRRGHSVGSHLPACTFALPLPTSLTTACLPACLPT